LHNDLDRVTELAHPNIVRVLDFGLDGDHFFVTSELADGENLRNVLDALSPDRLAPTEADAVIVSVGAALTYAHDLGIVHGDVRPENVIVTSDQSIKLANFALASLARDTPFAPALLDDTRALALLAHELYCGTPPGTDSSAQALKRLPQRRRKAIEAAIALPGLRSVNEFLEMAGLSADNRPDTTAPSRRWRMSPSWFALPVAALAAIGIALYAGDNIDWQRSLSALKSNLSDRSRDATVDPVTADAEPAADATAAETPPAASPMATPPATTPPPAAAPLARHEIAAPTAGEDRATPRSRSRPAPAARADVSGGLALSASSVTVYESQGVARVALKRIGASTRPLEVAWWTIDGTAHAGDDYAGFGARIETFAAGQAERTLLVPLATDDVAEQPETFFLHIASGAKAGAADELTAEIRIVDDDR
jgi:hypothetical protein